MVFFLQLYCILFFQDETMTSNNICNSTVPFTDWFPRIHHGESNCVFVVFFDNWRCKKVAQTSSLSFLFFIFFIFFYICDGAKIQIDSFFWLKEAIIYKRILFELISPSQCNGNALFCCSRLGDNPENTSTVAVIETSIWALLFLLHIFPVPILYMCTSYLHNVFWLTYMLKKIKLTWN